MDTSLIERAQILHGESQLIEERIGFIDKQVRELTEFLEHLSFIQETSETQLFSSLGKGLFLETSLRSKEIFVEAGAGVLIKKSLPEVQTIIRTQLESLSRMRSESQEQLTTLHGEFEQLVSKLESSSETKRKTI